MRRRLAVAIVGVTAGAILLFVIPLGLSLRKVYRDEELIRLERDTVAATRTIDVSAASRGDLLEVPRSRDRRVVYDRAGRVLGGSPQGGDTLVARAALRTGRPAIHERGGTLVAAVPILNNERLSGVLVAARSGAGAARDTHRAWLFLASLAAAVMLVAVAAAAVVARGLSRPLELVAASARRLGLGDFSVRAPRAQVAEVDAVADALDASAERLGEMVQRERDFTADASHQLRTPLTALRIQLEEAEMAGTQADPALALREVERLEQTIATLLAARRGTRAGAAETDLVPIAEEAESAWRPQLAAAGRRLALRVEAGSVRAAADAGVVREILNVLLENASRHGLGIVSVDVRRVDGWARVEVGDEGAGFGPEPEAAFERGRSRDGHGIGLALARSLANAEGGDVSVVAPGPRPVVALVLPSPD